MAEAENDGILVRQFEQGMEIPIRKNAETEYFIKKRLHVQSGIEGFTIFCDSKYASKNHCKIWRRGHAYWIKDCGSTNGTFLNGFQIETERELRFGDLIGIGVSHDNALVEYDDEKASCFIFQFTLFSENRNVDSADKTNFSSVIQSSEARTAEWVASTTAVTSSTSQRPTVTSIKEEAQSKESKSNHQPQNNAEPLSPPNAINPSASPVPPPAIPSTSPPTQPPPEVPSTSAQAKAKESNKSQPPTPTPPSKKDVPPPITSAKPKTKKSKSTSTPKQENNVDKPSTSTSVKSPPPTPTVPSNKDVPPSQTSTTSAQPKANESKKSKQSKENHTDQPSTFTSSGAKSKSRINGNGPRKKVKVEQKPKHIKQEYSKESETEDDDDDDDDEFADFINDATTSESGSSDDDDSFEESEDEEESDEIHKTSLSRRRRLKRNHKWHHPLPHRRESESSDEFIPDLGNSDDDVIEILRFSDDDDKEAKSEESDGSSEDEDNDGSDSDDFDVFKYLALQNEFSLCLKKVIYENESGAIKFSEEAREELNKGQRNALRKKWKLLKKKKRVRFAEEIERKASSESESDSLDELSPNDSRNYSRIVRPEDKDSSQVESGSDEGSDVIMLSPPPSPKTSKPKPKKNKSKPEEIEIMETSSEESESSSEYSSDETQVPCAPTPRVTSFILDGPPSTKTHLKGTKFLESNRIPLPSYVKNMPRKYGPQIYHPLPIRTINRNSAIYQSAVPSTSRFAQCEDAQQRKEMIREKLKAMALKKQQQKQNGMRRLPIKSRHVRNQDQEPRASTSTTSRNGNRDSVGRTTSQKKKGPISRSPPPNQASIPRAVASQSNAKTSTPPRPVTPLVRAPRNDRSNEAELREETCRYLEERLRLQSQTQTPKPANSNGSIPLQPGPSHIMSMSRPEMSSSSVSRPKEIEMKSPYPDDEIYKVMVHWIPSWIKEQNRHTDHPPVCNLRPSPVGMSYPCFVFYFETYYPLLMHEIWATVCSEYDRLASLKCDRSRARMTEYRIKIDCVETSQSCPLVSGCSEAGERNKWLILKYHTWVKNKGEINAKKDFLKLSFSCVTVPPSKKSQKVVFAFAVSKPALYEPMDNDDTECHPRLAGVGGFKFSETIFCRVPSSAMIDIHKISDLERICQISHKIREFKTLNRLQSFRLHKLILCPPPSPSSLENENMGENGESSSQSSSSMEFSEQLNSDQKAIIERVSKRVFSENPELILIHGPPGTGKTLTIVNLVLNILKASKKKFPNGKILVCAPSNVATDQVMRELMKAKWKLPSCKAFKVLRVGDNCSKDLERYTFATQVKEREEKFQEEAEERREGVLSEADVICATVSESGNSLMKNFALKMKNRKQVPFLCCIIDEACDATEPESLLPLSLGIDKLVLVGDPQQLRPQVLSRVAEDNHYGQSLFTRVFQYYNRNNNRCEQQSSPVMKLEVQYRMHHEIVQWPNEYFYRGRLITRRVQQLDNEFPLRPYCFLNMTFGQEKANTGKIKNEKVVDLVSTLVQIIDEALPLLPERTLGVIVAHPGHRFEVKKVLFRNHDFLSLKEVKVDTVDGFQGLEFDIIVIVCMQLESNGVLECRNGLNVALTRAKHSLYIVGDAKRLSKNRMWSDLIENATERGCNYDITTESASNDKVFQIKLKQRLMKQ